MTLRAENDGNAQCSYDDRLIVFITEGDRQLIDNNDEHSLTTPSCSRPVHAVCRGQSIRRKAGQPGNATHQVVQSVLA